MEQPRAPRIDSISPNLILAPSAFHPSLSPSFHLLPLTLTSIHLFPYSSIHFLRRPPTILRPFFCQKEKKKNIRLHVQGTSISSEHILPSSPTSSEGIGPGGVISDYTVVRARFFKANNGTSKVVNLGAEGEEEVLMEFLGR